ncbi:MAG: type II secretion system F family protein [Pseudomonadota bacterium]
MVDFVDLFFRPQLIVMILAAIAAAATVLTIALPALSKDKMNQRMKVMATERDKMRATRLAELAATEGKGSLRQKQSKGVVSQIVDTLGLRKAFETEEIRNKMKMAGLRGQTPLVTYVFGRLVMPIVLCIAALVYLFALSNHEYPPIAKIGAALAAGYFGFYLPNFFVENLVQRRQQAISQAFPDALDMLLICVQAGISIEQAFDKVSREITQQSVELAEEFRLTTAELSYLPERRQSFENLGKRTGLPGIKAVATALIQAERYGTPIGNALRVMAKENRDMRMSEAEKKAAALPPKLTVPMIVFFLPVLFVVILGPAIIQVMKLD